MSLAIYRKYRPKFFEELLGQEHIVAVLKNSAKKNRLAHAYLFFGPRGTGKTTAARLIAKIANCETRQKDEAFRSRGEPCNKCASCLTIDAGQALDVIEIDAASNRGIDEIRNLKESAKSSPVAFPYKVFIIDETHMLTREAFNALLKILEEPPEHTIFILATTELEKVPATIISRTQKFHFKKLTIATIIEKLKKIATVEKIDITDKAIELVASIAEGGLRDAESLLDQLASLGQKIDTETIEKIVGQVGFSRAAALTNLILKSDLKGALDYINKITEGGYNIIDLNKELIRYLRRAISLKFDERLEAIFQKELTRDELEQLKEHSRLITLPQHLSLIKSLIRAYSEMRYSPFTVIPLEIAIIENFSDQDYNGTT